MNQLPVFQPTSLTVSDVTRYLKQLFESDEILQDIWVRGEISNFSRPSSGHLYFTLKDGGAALRCVMWRTSAARLRTALRDGMAVEAHGYIGVYEVGGQYQLYADFIRPAGEGDLYLEFMRLKARLEADGLFDEIHKRPLPAWPRRIGIVTSPTGAALQDMLNIFRHRYPLVEVILCPAPVQGDEAPPAIVAALAQLNRIVKPDVILLARGGGSLEDLWAFNDERVVRAVAASEAPIITGVGHETDFTLVDFASDLRAPTPSAAAALAVPDRAELHSGLAEMEDRLYRAGQVLVSEQRWQLQNQQNRLARFSPISMIRTEQQRLDDLSRRLERAASHGLQLERAHLTTLTNRLQALNPLSILERGYAMVNRVNDGRLVDRVDRVSSGDQVEIRVSDGAFKASVIDS